jgi:hypothetical protein
LSDCPKRFSPTVQKFPAKGTSHTNAGIRCGAAPNCQHYVTDAQINSIPNQFAGPHGTGLKRSSFIVGKQCQTRSRSHLDKRRVTIARQTKASLYWPTEGVADYDSMPGATGSFGQNLSRSFSPISEGQRD